MQFDAIYSNFGDMDIEITDFSKKIGFVRIEFGRNFGQFEAILGNLKQFEAI